LIGEFAYNDEWISTWGNIDKLLALSGLPGRTTPIAAERMVERQAARLRELEEIKAKRLAEIERRRIEAETEKQRAPRWGAKEAKRLEIERLKQAMEKRKAD
jgi:hypothetical protein